MGCVVDVVVVFFFAFSEFGEFFFFFHFTSLLSYRKRDSKYLAQIGTTFPPGRRIRRLPLTNPVYMRAYWKQCLEMCNMSLNLCCNVKVSSFLDTML